MENKTPSGLPVVPTSTIQVFIRDLEQRVKESEESWDELGKEFRDKIHNENPDFEILANYLNDALPEGLGKYVALGIILSYNLLDRQGTINKIEELYEK
ncbi:MAG: hypothetical protein ACP5OG_04045 [Candidatus Nanoarchaeia archaeon]